MIKGCEETGEYFIRRPLRRGDSQVGLVCDEHEQQYGDVNMRKLTREEG